MHVDAGMHMDAAMHVDAAMDTSMHVDVEDELSTSPGPSSDGEEGRGRVFACTMCSYRTDRKNNLKR